MPQPYDIVDVDIERVEGRESMGSKEKFWFRRTETGRSWLFKYSRSFERSSKAGSAVSLDRAPEYCGEHWAEKIAAEVAELLGIAHARVELAREGRRPGVILEDFTEDTKKGNLIHGNELLVELDPNYPTHKQYHTREHTVDNVLAMLSQDFITLPGVVTWPRRIREPGDLFVGYLLLDALIGNTDRHHENWGILRHGEQAELAPSYDHASSLGRELRDTDRQARVRTKDAGYTVEAYAQKARSAFYRDPGDKKPLRPLQAFARAANLRPEAAALWREHLHGVSEQAMGEIIERVPDEAMSVAARDFSLRVLRYNRGRLLELELD